MTAKTVLVTGASGFIGSALVHQLSDILTLIACYRAKPKTTVLNHEHKTVSIPSIHQRTDWAPHLQGVEVVIHLAGYAHKSKRVDYDELYAVNVEGSKRLVEQAAAAGVRRFIFISSVKAVAESTVMGQPVNENTLEHPEDEYGRSKLAAEKAIVTACEKSEMEYVIIRPALVIGPNVKGNLLSLKKWVSKGWPLPTGAIHNRRSLLSLSHLLNLIEKCIDHPNAANQIFLAADDQPISTPQLIHVFEKTLGKQIIQIPVPVILLKLIGVMSGRSAQVQRLCGDLEVDASHAYECLGWQAQSEEETLFDLNKEKRRC